MTQIKLTPSQAEQKALLIKNLALLTDKDEGKLTQNDRQVIFKEMGQTAHLLHMSLAPKPKHHNYMIKNRGLDPSDPNFYMHIHPVEDLLAYLEDIHANDDPQEQTIGHVFHFEIYTRRWGHYDHYKLTRTETGWDFTGNATFNNGLCDPSGKPFLFKTLDHEFVNYPHDLGEYLSYLWQAANDRGLSPEQVQESLTNLSKWIEICESSTPKGIFKGYN